MQAQKWLAPARLSVGRKKLAATTLLHELVLFGAPSLALSISLSSSPSLALAIALSRSRYRPLSLSRPRALSRPLSCPSLSRFWALGGGFRSGCPGGAGCGGLSGYRAEVDIYNATAGSWSTARLAQGRMRLAAASARPTHEHRMAVLHGRRSAHSLNTKYVRDEARSHSFGPPYKNKSGPPYDAARAPYSAVC